MKIQYNLASALLRRGRIDTETLTEVERRVQNQQRLDDILFSPERLDLAPDIFPPHMVGAFLERNRNQQVREQDTWETYLKRMTSDRKLSTLRMLSRQIHAAAKADATRRTAAVHPVVFREVETQHYKSLEERYFVFAEQFAQKTFTEIENTPLGNMVQQLVRAYETSRGVGVPNAFFTMMDHFREIGLSQQRDVKHKYPVHGLLYGSVLTLPEKLQERMERAGRIVLDNFVSTLSSPEQALFFSIDFFLTESDEIYIGFDVHEQQIGMGLQQQLGVDSSACFYTAAMEVIGLRAFDGEVKLCYDAELCAKNQLYKMEVQALRENLTVAGFKIGSTGYPLRLFGGVEGYPDKEVTALTDDKLFIDRLLKKREEELKERGVNVPKTYCCSAADVIHSSKEIVGVLENERVFIHPTVHHGFKPFELDLGTPVSAAILTQTFSKYRSLADVPIIVMKRLPNTIKFGEKRYAHEVRAYFVPGEPQ